MSTTSKTRWSFKKLLIAPSGGCGCGSKEMSTDHIYEPMPKSKATTFSGDEYTSTTFSINLENSPNDSCPDRETVGPGPKIRDSFAVVKDSDDPYGDFRQSMLQMIFEKEIYSRSDLQQLLDCFLQLNSPRHHEIIVRAFMEIWNGGANGGDGGGQGATPLPCSSSKDTWVAM